VDEFLLLDRAAPAGTRRFIRELRRRDFDLAIDLQRLTKSGLITRLCGAPRRLGFDRQRCKEQNSWFTNEKIPSRTAPGTTLDQYLEFADHLELPPTPVTWELPIEAPPPASTVPDATPDNARTSTADRTAGGGPNIVINLGASKEANLWSVGAWAELCLALHKTIGARIELSGGPQDRPRATEVATRAGIPLGDRVGQLSLKQTGGLIAEADLFIGCDTGPLHMAVAVNTPVVALFGSSDPARTGPWGQAEGVVQAPPPAAGCAPCRKRTCFVAGHPCMADLSVAAVMERVQARL
jgi:ADP-heptose:LPS heptosyltransferase